MIHDEYRYTSGNKGSLLVMGTQLPFLVLPLHFRSEVTELELGKAQKEAIAGDPGAL